MLTDGDYCVRLVDLPPKTKGMTVIDEAGFANIYVNSRLSAEQRRRVIQHEIGHVERDDAHNQANIRQVEGC